MKEIEDEEDHQCPNYQVKKNRKNHRNEHKHETEMTGDEMNEGTLL